MVKIALGIFILLFSNVSFAANLPPAFEAHYVLKKGFFKIGKATRRFKPHDGHFQYVSDSKTTGMIATLFKEHILQTSNFDFEDNVIKPLRYNYSRNEGKKTVAQVYDWQNKVVQSQSGKKKHEYAIPEIVQDQSIYQLSLMLDLSDGKRNFTYQIAENVRLVDYKVKQIGNERLKTALGKMDTVVLQINYKKNKTTIWCAKKKYFLPVKIKHEENGTSFTAEIKSIDGF